MTLKMTNQTKVYNNSKCVRAPNNITLKYIKQKLTDKRIYRKIHN